MPFLAATGPGNRPSSESCQVRSSATTASFPSPAARTTTHARSQSFSRNSPFFPIFQSLKTFTCRIAATQLAESTADEMGALAAEALAMIDPALVLFLRRPVSSLDLHQRQLVEIARALSSGAKLILLDEPTANLTFADAERLFAVLRRLTTRGISILLVSHRMSEIRAVADVCTILRDGRSVVDRRALADISDEEIVQAMMGEGREKVEIAMEAREITAVGAFSGPCQRRSLPGASGRKHSRTRRRA